MIILAGIIAISLISCGGGTTQKETAKEKVNNDLAKLNLKGKVMSLQHNLFRVDDENDELNEEYKLSGKEFFFGYLLTGILQVHF